MAGIIEYVQQELRTMEEKPFSEVDSLVLSQLAYLQLGCLVPHQGRPGSLPLGSLLRAEYFDDLFRQLWYPERNKELLVALCASPRFRNLLLSNFVDLHDPVQETQFCAVTLQLGPGLRYLAFRGTDADVVGWKEDFNMAFQSPVPAQRLAVKYTCRAARQAPGGLMLGGHSKGGNLAAYAAIHSPLPYQDRITAAYSHDGPGFKHSPEGEPGFARIADRLHRTMPQSALVGLLLEYQGSYSVVKSDRLGVMQHDPFSWQVENGEFVRLEEISAGARHLNQTLNSWLNTQSDAQRESFVDALFGVLDAFNIKSFADNKWDWQQIPAMLGTLKHLDSDTRQMLQNTFREIALMGVRHQTDQKKD